MIQYIYWGEWYCLCDKRVHLPPMLFSCDWFKYGVIWGSICTIVPNWSNMSMSVPGRRADRLSVWWMWCYRSTKALCCPIQQGIQAGISRLCVGASDAYMPLAASSLQTGKARRLASSLCWHCMGPVWRSKLCAKHFGIWLPQHPGPSECHVQASQRCHLSLNCLHKANRNGYCLYWDLHWTSISNLHWIVIWTTGYVQSIACVN